MEGGRFEVALEATGRPDPDPMAPNADSGPRTPVAAAVAQGRFMANSSERLRWRSEAATLGLDAVPTMVFDEVDSGIGGAVAAAVA